MILLDCEVSLEELVGRHDTLSNRQLAETVIEMQQWLNSNHIDHLMRYKGRNTLVIHALGFDVSIPYYIMMSKDDAIVFKLKFGL